MGPACSRAARRALGDYIGFFVGYTNWIQSCTWKASIALVVGRYSGRLLPVLRGHLTTVALAVFLALVAINWVQVRMRGWVQQLTSLAKVLDLGALVVAAFALPNSSMPAAAPPPMPHGVALLATLALALAMQGVIYTCYGYHQPVTFGEELRDPGREIPTVFVLRRSAPDTPRPCHGWDYSWTTGIGLAISLAFLFGVAIADPLHSWIALGILVASCRFIAACEGCSGRYGCGGRVMTRGEMHEANHGDGKCAACEQHPGGCC